MMRDITAEWRAAEITEPQATGAVAWLTDTTADDVFGYVVVAVFNQDGRPTGMKLVSSFGTDRAAVRQVLLHAAAHIAGRCRRCRLLAKMRANGTG